MKILKILTLALLGGIYIAGCADDVTDTQYDTREETTPAGVITAISPTRAIAGSDTLTITGENFSSTASENVVYFFEDVHAEAFSATPTTIKVVVPPDISEDLDSAKIRVNVKTSHKFSNEFICSLLAPKVLISMDNNENASMVTVNGSDEVYVSVTSPGPVKKYTVKIANGEVTTGYGNSGQYQDWNDIAVGPDGNIYGVVKNLAGIYYFPQTPNSAAKTFSGVSGMGTGKGLLFIEFDEFGNLWTGGFDNSESIYRFTPAKELSSFAVSQGRIVDAKAFNGKMYVVAINNTTNDSKIYRASYDATGITGTFELYYDFSAYHPQTRINTIAFSESGVLYMGTNGEDGIYVANSTSTAPESLYSGAFSKNINKIEWGTGKYFYVIWEDPTKSDDKVKKYLYKTPTKENGAPNYGWN